MNQIQEVQTHAGVTVTVKGISLSRDLQSNSKTVFHIVGQTGGKIIYGVSHTGSTNGWKDQFAVNYKNLNYDILELVAFVNDQQIGKGHLNLLQVTTKSGAVFDQEIQLRKNGNVVGFLPVQVSKTFKQQIVGGVKPPMVNLITNPHDEQPEHTPNLGIQQIRADKRNFFSCMDAGTGWEFMPYSFQTKRRQFYDSVSPTGVFEEIKSRVGFSSNADNQEQQPFQSNSVQQNHLF